VVVHFKKKILLGCAVDPWWVIPWWYFLHFL